MSVNSSNTKNGLSNEFAKHSVLIVAVAGIGLLTGIPFHGAADAVAGVILSPFVT
jgi:hypothetical protein